MRFLRGISTIVGRSKAVARCSGWYIAGRFDAVAVRFVKVGDCHARRLCVVFTRESVEIAHGTAE